MIEDFLTQFNPFSMREFYRYISNTLYIFLNFTICRYIFYTAGTSVLYIFLTKTKQNGNNKKLHAFYLIFFVIFKEFFNPNISKNYKS